MAEIKGEHRLSALSLILIGVAALVLGNTSYVLLWGTTVGAVGLFVGLGGFVLLIIGIVRAVRERGERQRLADRAARVTVANGHASADGVSVELQRLTELHSTGALSDAEFAAAKAKVLGS